MYVQHEHDLSRMSKSVQAPSSAILPVCILWLTLESMSRSFFYTKAFFIGLEPIFFCSDLTLRVYYEFVVISLGFKQLVCDSYNQNLFLLD